jgi:hypothetical protein
MASEQPYEKEEKRIFENFGKKQYRKEVDTGIFAREGKKKKNTEQTSYLKLEILTEEQHFAPKRWSCSELTNKGDDTSLRD